MSFEALRVELRLASPLYLTGQPLHLDALLSYDRVRHEPGASAGPHPVAWEPTEEVSLPLAIMRDGPRWWYRASAVWPVGARSVQFWGKRFDEQHLDLAHMGKATQVVTTLGPYKAMKVPVEACFVNRLIFFAVGDRYMVRKRLSRLRFVGKKASQCYGQISGLTVDAVGSEDNLGLDWRREDGGPARNLPVAWARARGLQFDGEITAPLRPPYWRRSEAVTCRVAR